MSILTRREREDPERTEWGRKAGTWQSSVQGSLSLGHVWGTVGMCLSHPAFWEGGVGMPRPGTTQASPSRALPGKRVWERLARRVDNSGFQVASVRQGL